MDDRDGYDISRRGGDVRLASFKILARGRVRLDWSNGIIDRRALKPVAKHLRALASLDPMTMPVGTVVTINEQGQVASSEDYRVRRGRKPLGAVAMTSAERNARWLDRVRRGLA